MGLPIYLLESLQTLADNYRQHREASLAENVQPAVVPPMRTVYVSHDKQEIAQLRQRVETEVENSRLQPDESLDDWTLIGDPAFVRDGIHRYQETLGMTHMVYPAAFAGLSDAQLRKASLLAESVLGK